MDKSLVYILCINAPMTTAAISSALLPGFFYWRPRMGTYPQYQTNQQRYPPNQPTSRNIKKEMVVLIDGYSLGLTVMAMSAAYFAAGKPFLHLHPMHASYYTNVYRWGLRHLSLIPHWLGGMGGTAGSNYIDTHKVWRRRFYYMEEMVPHWLRKLTPWVTKEEWTAEERFLPLYLKFAEPAFGKHYHYPQKDFDDYKSEITVETIENLDTNANPNVIVRR